VGISADPALVPDADALGATIGAVLDELGRAAPVHPARLRGANRRTAELT